MCYAISILSNRISSTDKAQKSKHAEVLEIVAHQKREIEELEAECSMLYLLVLGLARSSHPKLSIGSAPAIPIDEETVQQALGELEMEQLDQEPQVPTEIKQEAHSGHVFS